MKEKINFPSSNDKIWDSINFELDNVIPSVFKKSVISKLSSSELSQKFDTWLHQFFVDRFGTKQKIEHFKRNPRKNRELENLRKKKNSCKKAFKALQKAGLSNSDEAMHISKQ